MSRLYDVRHTTTYQYEEEVTASYGRAHLVPRDSAGQVRVGDHLVIRPEPDLVRESRDFYGNRSLYVEVHTAHTELVVTALSRVSVDRVALDDGMAGGELPWEQVVRLVEEGLEIADGSGVDPDQAADALRIRDFRLPSRHVLPSGEVRAFAEEVFLPGRPVWESVRSLVSRINADLEYHPGATSVSTTLAEVLRLREGVCQDFAHLAVGVLRVVGLPARYVSGYLETTPPPGRRKLVGADASHAWVSVYLPQVGWLDLDPTNDRVVDDSYVLTAWGRDYADVPPLKGVIYTEGGSTELSVAVDVSRVS